jgi:hypothetical protein
MISKLLKDKIALYNLSMMIMVWVSSSFTFNLLNFLVKYMPGDIYFNSVISGLSCVAMLFQSTLVNKLGARGGMMASFVITVISTIWLSFFSHDTDAVLLYAFVLFLAKSGASLTFGFAYTIHIDLFPSNFVVSSYGICNFFCRGLTIFAPFIAEVPSAWVPLLFLNLSSASGLLATVFLKKRIEPAEPPIPEPTLGKEDT